MKKLTQRHKVLIAWLLFAACAIGLAANVIIWKLGLTAASSPYDAVQTVFWSGVVPLVFSFLAVLIINRRPDNRVGWLMMLIGLATLNPASSIVETMATSPERLTFGLWLVLWMDTWSWMPAIFPLFLILLHFPTGQPPSSRWNWVNRLALGMGVFFLLYSAFGTEIGPLDGRWVTTNPVGFYSFEIIDKLFLVVWTAGLVTLLVASVLSLFVRYRRAPTNMRLQIKWLLFAGLFFTVIFISSAGKSDSNSIGIQDILFVLSILAIPAAIAIAILRHRLYDIDLIIRRTLVYSLLTGVLSLVYFGGVALSQNFLSGNRGQLPPFVIVLTTLAIATLFNPLRRRLQETIDRHFYRQKYDAEKALGEFAKSARSSTNLLELSSKLVDVVCETLQPDSVNLWLNPGNPQTEQEKI